MGTNLNICSYSAVKAIYASWKNILHIVMQLYPVHDFALYFYKVCLKLIQVCGMWRRVVEWKVSDVRKYCIAFIFKGQAPLLYDTRNVGSN
jgi:hypothetical protein